MRLVQENFLLSIVTESFRRLKVPVRTENYPEENETEPENPRQGVKSKSDWYQEALTAKEVMFRVVALKERGKMRDKLRTKT